MENFGEIYEILFNGIGVKKIIYFKLIDERYYYIIKNVFKGRF